MKKKYEFTGEEESIFGMVVRRIRRFDGLLGGWIESEANLAQEGECFVYDESYVIDDARVEGNAQVYGGSLVCECAYIKDNARVESSIVDGEDVIAGNTVMSWVNRRTERAIEHLSA